MVLLFLCLLRVSVLVWVGILVLVLIFMLVSTVLWIVVSLWGLLACCWGLWGFSSAWIGSWGSVFLGVSVFSWEASVFPVLAETLFLFFLAGFAADASSFAVAATVSGLASSAFTSSAIGVISSTFPLLLVLPELLQLPLPLPGLLGAAFCRSLCSFLPELLRYWRWFPWRWNNPLLL